MRIDRYAFGMHIGNPTTDNWEPIPFTDEEVAELVRIDSRLEVVEVEELNCIRLKSDRPLLHYFSLGDYCYSIYLEDGFYDKSGIYTPLTPLVFMLDQFEALKEKAMKYSCINFSRNHHVSLLYKPEA